MSDRIDELLAKVEIAHHSFNLIGQPEIEIKMVPMKIKHFKILLKASEGIIRNDLMLDDSGIKELRKIDTTFDEVLKDCVVSPIDFDPLKLYSDDWMYLMAMLRSISKGNIIDLEIPCRGKIEITNEAGKIETKNCDKVIRKTINLNDLQKKVFPDNKNVISLSDDIQVSLSPPFRKDDYDVLDLIETYKNGPDDTELNLTRLATTISSVKMSDTIISDLNLAEKVKIMDSFSSKQKDEAKEVFETMSFGLPVFVNLECEKCGKKMEERLVDLSDFFII